MPGTGTSTADRESLYKAKADKPAFVQVPDMGFIMIDGTGDPNTSEDFKDSVQALYSLSYTLKFALKKELGLQYRVGPLEGLWWAEDMAAFNSQSKSDYRWTLMVVQPDDVNPERFERARDDAGRKKTLPALARARFERFEEGLSAQVLHLGPYSAEAPTIASLHAFIVDHGYTFDGRKQRHHEIYLGDPRRAAPAKLRTIIRQPVSA